MEGIHIQGSSLNAFGASKSNPYFSFGSKLDDTYHTQIRTGSLPLNANLYQFQKLPTPDCVCLGKSEKNK